MARPTGFINFEIVGNQQGVQRMLYAIDSALSPVGLASFLHGDVEHWIKDRAERRFMNEGDDAVGKWAPLRQATSEIREHQGFTGDHPINRRTGELEAYITQGNADVTAAPGLAVLTYPNNTPQTPGLRQKMETAQRGRSKPSTVPRPVLGLGEADLAHVLTSLAFFIQRVGKSVGAHF